MSKCLVKKEIYIYMSKWFGVYRLVRSWVMDDLVVDVVVLVMDWEIYL